MREQNVVIRAHAVDERDRHPAAGVAIPGVGVVLGQREQRQDLLHVAPQIRIELLLLRKHPRVLEVAEADVERGERKPRSIRLGNPGRELRLEVTQIARRAEHVLPGIEEVLDAEVAGGVLGDLHEAAHAGFALGERIPFRLLVRDGREQPPLDVGALLHVAEHRLPLRQRGADAFLERARIHALERALVRDISLGEAVDESVPLHAGKKASRSDRSCENRGGTIHATSRLAPAGNATS